MQYLSSAALGKPINLKKKVGAVKGKLKLCCIHPDLLEVFKITRLDQVFEIYPEEQAGPRQVLIRAGRLATKVRRDFEDGRRNLPAGAFCAFVRSIPSLRGRHGVP